MTSVNQRQNPQQYQLLDQNGRYLATVKVENFQLAVEKGNILVRMQGDSDKQQQYIMEQLKSGKLTIKNNQTGKLEVATLQNLGLPLITYGFSGLADQINLLKNPDFQNNNPPNELSSPFPQLEQ